ncbi:MAG: glycine zipper 2TM domain-containing protein [Caldimonas sp.]
MGNARLAPAELLAKLLPSCQATTMCRRGRQPSEACMINRSLATPLAAVALAALAACSTTADNRYSAPSTTPTYGQAGTYAEYGVVRSIDLVPVASRTTGGGAILGAVVGAVVGNQFGSGTGRAAATAGGAVAGAVAGNAIEKRTRKEDEVFRVSVRFDNGSVRDFDYQRIDDLRIGDRVRLDGGQLHYVP